jgi:hypothetical protein
MRTPAYPVRTPWVPVRTPCVPHAYPMRTPAYPGSTLGVPRGYPVSAGEYPMSAPGALQIKMRTVYGDTDFDTNRQNVLRFVTVQHSLDGRKLAMHVSTPEYPVSTRRVPHEYPGRHCPALPRRPQARDAREYP